MSRLGDAVRTAREQRRWTMGELARRVGYSDASMIKQIEQGHKLPSLEKARALSLHLELTLCQLVGDAPMTPPFPLSGEDFAQELMRRALPVFLRNDGEAVFTTADLIAVVEGAIEGTVQRAVLALQDEVRKWGERRELVGVTDTEGAA